MSFAYAEVLEYVTQDIIGGDIAGDGREVMDALTDVLTKEITRYAVLQALTYTTDALLRLDQRFIVTHIGHNHILLTDLRNSGSLYQKVVQSVHSISVFGRYPNLGVCWSRQGGRIITLVVYCDKMLAL